MIGDMGTIVGIAGLLIAWILFSKVIQAKTQTRRNIKAAIVVLLFATLILRFSHDLYSWISRTAFSAKKQGEIALIYSPLRIPENQENSYCQRFSTPDGQPIMNISVRDDGRYCGEFWGFETNKEIVLPYKDIGNNRVEYWASPGLRIIGPGPRS